MEIQYTSDNGGNLQKAQGSDGRLNVSSRSDSRSYYNSRFEGQAYSVPFEYSVGEAGEFCIYLRNTSSIGKALVIDSIGVNCDSVSRFKLKYISGTAAGGTAVTPTNLNATSGNAATATAMEGASAATGITGLTDGALIDYLFVAAGGHEEFRLDDRLRLGQNDAIALELHEGTTADIAGVIFFYFE